MNNSPARANTRAGNSNKALTLDAVTEATKPGTSETGDCTKAKLGETPKKPRVLTSPVASPESVKTSDSIAATLTDLVIVTPAEVRYVT